MNVRFVLVCEGASDSGLAVHLQILCVECGASEAIGTAPDFSLLPNPPGHDVKSRITAALRLDPAANLVFVHRDADGRTERRRLREITGASETFDVPIIPVIPIQATEAWLLLDELAIRAVVENPRGNRRLNLPRPRAIEGLSDPKRRLRESLEIASELKGRRLTELKRSFGHHRALLLERLDLSGSIVQLSAWQKLVERTRAGVASLVD
jgi:hypothetical protein